MSSTRHAEADIVIVGGGAAGLAAAVRGIDRGARVVVLEKSEGLGGSALLSAGILWTAPDIDVLRQIQPNGDNHLGGVVVAGYEQAVSDVRDAGVEVSAEWTDHLGWGRACKIDIKGLVDAWGSKIRDQGTLVTGVRSVEILRTGGVVRGVRYQRGPRSFEVSALAVILATGGIQGDAELRQRFIGSGADEIAVRSNPHSVGDGFRLGISAGVAPSKFLSRFYGHTLPSPLEVEQEVLLRLTLYFSSHGVIVNREGRRFTDESLGDEVSTQRLVAQTAHRGVLIWDDRAHSDHALAEPYPSGLVLDRYEEAAARGARSASAGSLDELVETVAGWGVDAANLKVTLANYVKASGGERLPLDAPLPSVPATLSHPPYRALEIQPCITIPFGGLRVDEDARGLDHDGHVVPGLYVIGADAGGIQDLRYVGGIIFALVFGRRAADAAFPPFATSENP